MAKKTKAEEKLKERDDSSVDQTIEEEENGFGGLPDRDLKKNLGCG